MSAGFTGQSDAAAERHAAGADTHGKGAAVMSGVSASVMDSFDAIEKRKAAPKVRVGKARKDAPAERIVHRQIVSALRQLGYIVAHVPNGSALPGNELARWKQSAVLTADGMMAGFPDLMIIDRQGRMGLIEVKREGGALRDDQVRIIGLLRRWNVPVATVCTLDDALAAVAGWWA
jgi:CheY-like chemotaxis protein